MKKGFKLFVSMFFAAFAVVILAACSNGKPKQAMTQVSLLIDEIYSKNERFDKDNKSIGSFVNSDIELPFTTTVDGEVFEISYSLTEVKDENNTKLDVNAEAKTAKVAVTQTGEEQQFTLNVAIKKETKAWTFKVDKLDLSMEVTQAEVDAKNPMTYEQYAKAKGTDEVYVQGWITSAHNFDAGYKNGSVWLQDENGGYYGYRVKVATQREWDTYFKTGNKITLKGVMSPYKGWQEVGQGCTYEFIKDAPKKEFPANDVTQLLSNNAPDSAEVLALQNTRVSVEGKVLNIPSYDSKEMFLRLGVGANEYTVHIKRDYLSAKSCPKDLFKDLQIGYTIKVEGLTSVKGTLNICPSTKNFFSITSKEVTDADRVAAAVSEVKTLPVQYQYTEDAKLDLLTEFKTADGAIIPVTYELRTAKGNGFELVNDAEKKTSTLEVTANGLTSSEAQLVAIINFNEVPTQKVVFKVTTATDKDVHKDVWQDLQKEVNLPGIVTPKNVGQRILLPSVTTEGAKVTYSFEEETANTIFNLGETKVTHTSYIDIIAAPDNVDFKEFTLVAKVEYQNPNNKKDEAGKDSNPPVTAKELKFKIKTIKELKPATAEEVKAMYDNFVAAKSGDKVSFEGVVSAVSSEKGMLTLQYGEQSVYVYFKNVDFSSKQFPLNSLVHVDAEKDNFKGLNRIKVTNLSQLYVLAYKQEAVKYTDITETLLTSTDLKADLAKMQGKLITFTDAVFDGKYFKVGKNQLYFYEDKKIFKTNGDELVPGHKYTIKGFLNWFNEPQVTPTAKDWAIETGVLTDQEVLDMQCEPFANQINKSFTYVDTKYVLPTLEGYTVTYELLAGGAEGIKLNADKTALEFVATASVQKATLKYTVSKEGCEAKSNEVSISLGKANYVRFNQDEGSLSTSGNNAKLLGLDDSFTVTLVNDESVFYNTKSNGAEFDYDGNKDKTKKLSEVLKLKGNQFGFGAQLTFANTKKITSVTIELRASNTKSKVQELKVVAGGAVQLFDLPDTKGKITIKFEQPVDSFTLVNQSKGSDNTHIFIKSLDFNFAA